jgi:predicted kinase
MLMGSPAAGKSTLAQTFVARGYVRLNRDEIGGRLADLVPVLERTLESGARHVVLDNTYATRAARNQVIEAAWKHGVGVRCVWLETSLADAQRNAAQRMIERHGRLLGPEEMRQAGRRDPSVYGPRVLLDFRRALEPPSLDEGFSSIDAVPFERRGDDRSSSRRAVIVEEQVLRELDREAAGPLLRRLAGEGWLLLAIGWGPGAGEAPAAIDVHGLSLALACCTHAASGPAVCWCRPPLPGLAVSLIHRHGLDPRRSILVGGSTGRALAERCGLRHAPPEAFFAGPSPHLQALLL